MLITCPKCETTFALPDELFKPGKKARCSQCGNVFAMTLPAGDAPAPEAPAKKEKEKKAASGSFFAAQKKKIIAGVAVLLLCVLGYGGWLMASSMFGGAEEEVVAPELTAEEQAKAAHERMLKTVALEDIRQYLVDNNQFGRGMVIQGVAVNVSDSNKDYITIEARLLDAQNRILTHVQQLCGVSMSLFQLNTLSAEEIKEFLNNRITILTNNTNIPPGGRVPFVVVFPEPSSKMKAFEIHVIDVRESPVQ